MAFLIGGANSADTGFKISNSLRLNSGDSPNLSWTPASDGSQTTCTFSCWVKRSLLGSHLQPIWSTKHPTDNVNGIVFMVGTGAENKMHLVVAGTDNSNFGQTSTNVFRDVSAWYHFVARIDTTQGVAANRVRVYVNNVSVTISGTPGYPDEDETCRLSNDDRPHTIGEDEQDNIHFDGYVAEVAFIDGTSYGPDTFAEADEDSGIWKPKDFKDDVTFGSNGYYLEFKETGTSQNSSGLGADTSGNDNHFAVNNLAAIDQATDTPQNSFATLNSLYPATEANFSQGNCRYVGGTTAGNGVNQMAAGTFAVANGKWYFECKLINVASNGMIHTAIGIASVNHPSLIGTGGAYPWTSGWVNYNHYLYTPDGTSATGNTSSSYGSAIDEDDIVGVALDLDNDAIYYSDNGTFINSGDPTSGSSKTNAAPNFPSDPGPWILGFNGDASSGDAAGLEYNFGGCSAFTVSSGNADTNGYGNFEYAVPSGYYAPCTKNLAEYG